MTVRLCAPAFPGDKSTIYHAHQKVAHRADPDVEIERGNHNAAGPALEQPLRGWHPIEVLHFSFRSVEQLERKARGGWLRSPRRRTRPSTSSFSTRRTARASSTPSTRTMRSRMPQLEHGLADGSLAVDTRLRDVLRTLREPDGRYRVPEAGTPLAFGTPDLADSAAYAAEASVLVGIDGIVRAEQRVDALEARLARLRTLPRR